MVSSKNETDPVLSPREAHLFTRIKRSRGNWVASEILTEYEYGPEANWPLNARTIVAGTVRSMMKKFSYTHSSIRILKKGGGRGGVKYRIEGDE